MKKVVLNDLATVNGGSSCTSDSSLLYGAGVAMMMLPGVQLAGFIVASAGYIMQVNCK